MAELKIENVGDNKVAPQNIEFTTETSDKGVPFWYEYKPYIHDKDGTMELEIKHDFLHDTGLEKFNFDNPQVDAPNLAASMVKLMRKLGGYGLAANQVGLPLRMFVIEGEPAYAIFNPRITYFGDEKILLEEGCLSYPGMSDGITSRVFQHEFDHTEGVDFTQKVSKMKVQMAKKKWTKKYGRTKLSLPSSL